MLINNNITLVRLEFDIILNTVILMKNIDFSKTSITLVL